MELINFNPCEDEIILTKGQVESFYMSSTIFYVTHLLLLLLFVTIVVALKITSWVFILVVFLCIRNYRILKKKKLTISIYEITLFEVKNSFTIKFNEIKKIIIYRSNAISLTLYSGDEYIIPPGFTRYNVIEYILIFQDHDRWNTEWDFESDIKLVIDRISSEVVRQQY